MSNQDTQIQNMQDWADQLLAYGNLPVSYGNVEALTSMVDYEGGMTKNSGGATNPLDVRNGPNGQIQPYADNQAGLIGTLNTIQQNDPQFYDALKSTTGQNPTGDITALAASQWEGVNPGAAKANQDYAANVGTTLTSIYGANSHLASMITTPSGTKAAASKSRYDFLTQAMIQLDATLNSGGTLPLVEILARGALALGFASVGIVGIFSIVSGGKLGIGGIPGIAAGFLAGKDTGMHNLFSKAGISHKTAPDTETAQQRLALAQNRLGLSQSREQRMSLESEKRSIENAQKRAAEAQRIQLADYRAQTQRKSINLKTRQTRNLEKATKVGVNP